MISKGYLEYRRREYCKDVKCSVQMELDEKAEGSIEYEKIRKRCSTSCLHTTWQFHNWLINKGFIILVSSQLNNNERTILSNINRSLLEWIDQQVQDKRFKDRNELIEKAIVHYQKVKEETNWE